MVRNPWEHFHSDYHFCRRAAREEPQIAGPFGEKARLAMKQSFADFVRMHAGAMESGGIWRYYCHADDGRLLVDRAIHFNRLQEEWPRLVSSLGIPPIELPRENVTAERPRWDWRRDYTPDLVELVRQACGADIAEFEFTFW